MISSSAEKIKFKPLDSLFGGEEKQTEGEVIRVPLSELHAFQGHPFKVTDDTSMEELTNSIWKYGVLVPATVRKRPEGGYEIISGHRRKHACELVGLHDMPVIVRPYGTDEATIVMVDSNLQRENILPSEKAFAYKMKLDAFNHQGVKGEKHTADLVGEPAGESGRTVQRYVRLTELITPILDLIDRRVLPLAVGEALSFLRKGEQETVKTFLDSQVPISKAQANILKEMSQENILSEADIAGVLSAIKEKRISSIPIRRIRKYFPKSYSSKQIEGVIFQLLEKWKSEQEL